MKIRGFRIVWFAAILSMACTTKVSEWFLLNAVPDKYILVYYHNGQHTDKVKWQNNELDNEAKVANVLFQPIQKEDVKEPYYALYYNNRLQAEYSRYDSLRTLFSSPLRREIADELMDGKLCVMLFLKTGIPEKDERRMEIIQHTISSSPFRDVITLKELDRNNWEEKHFVSMLLQVESDLKEIQEPMLFGIFGQFRALEPLLANGISPENINLMIDFLTADCSCLIKDNLPGMSILSETSWENPEPAMVNKILDDNPALLHH
ncbi:MAG: hypothetical protein WCY58_07495 [Mariniphaga sp.]|nr:hypothetical protein [Mariniphaga sp.]